MCLTQASGMEDTPRWHRSRLSTVRRTIAQGNLGYLHGELSNSEVTLLEKVSDSPDTVDGPALEDFIVKSPKFLTAYLAVLLGRNSIPEELKKLDALKEDERKEAIEFLLCWCVNNGKPKLFIDLVTELVEVKWLIPEDNHPALLAACDKNDYELVSELVDRGFRLKSGHRERQKKLKSFSWNFLKFRQEDASKVERGDEVIFDLAILERCVKPAYIFACYKTTLERTNVANPRFDCDCIKDTTLPKFRKQKVVVLTMTPLGEDEPEFKGGLNKQMAMEIASNLEHSLCPHERNFRTDEDCTVHPECNDPIFRCFALSKSASTIANRFPEYRSEYESIGIAANKLSADLLDECTSLNEASYLLKDPFASSKYLGKTDFFKYPRLKLAIEHNHKEFVGHKYCQQILGKEWHTGVDWVGRPFKYKLLYAISINILAPFLFFSWAWTQFGRDVYKMKGKDFSETEDEIKKKSWVKKKFYQYVMHCHNMKRSIDVPLNRFLIFSGYYLLYLFFIFNVASYPVETRTEPYQSFTVNSHLLLLCYAVAMLWQDFKIMVSLRSMNVFFKKFWRAYDLVLHILLLLTLVSRFIVSNWEFQLRSDFISFSSVITSLTVTVSINRIVYWFLLHDIIGPVVINMARAVLDIFIIGITYAVMLFAFTSGMTFLVAERRAFLLSKNETANYDIAHNETKYQKILVSLFWGFFDPGKPDFFGEDNEDDDFYAGVGYAIYAIYLLVIVIVLLNMLIAILNATVQKVYDQKQLYWKFSRASVWMEFFDDQLSSPPIPFGSLQIFWYFSYVVLHLIFKSKNQLQPDAQKPKEEICKGRQNQANLVSSLVERYLARNHHRKEEIPPQGSPKNKETSDA